MKNIKVEPVDGDEDEIEFDEFSLEAALETAAGIRSELNEVHWVDYRKHQEQFGFLFGVPGMKLKLLNDLLYYQGGYPGPNSPPKHESLGKRFAEGFRYLWLVGRSDDLNQHLKKMGLKVVVVDESKLLLPLKSPTPTDPFIDFCRKSGRKLPKKWDTRSVLGWFTEYCCSLQKTICGKANLIKKNCYADAKAAVGDLGKAEFRETVALRLRTSKVLEPLSTSSEIQGVSHTKAFASVEKRKQRLKKRLEVNNRRIRGFQTSMAVAVKDKPPKTVNVSKSATGKKP